MARKTREDRDLEYLAEKKTYMEKRKYKYITREIADKYQKKVASLGEVSIEDINERRKIRIELQEQYGLEELEAINILKGYYIAEIIRKYERIRDLIPLQIAKERAIKVDEEEDD